MATEQEIRTDIANIYRKIEQCYRSKADLQRNIDVQRTDMVSLDISIKEDEGRVANGKRPRYDKEAMLENINRCKRNIVLFEDTINKESDTIEKFLGMIKVLEEDLKRPVEIVFDAKTGQVISDSSK